MIRIAIPVLALGAIGCGHLGYVTGAGDLVTETRQVSQFKRIEVSGNMAVEVAPGPFSLSLTAEPNILPLITTEVRNGNLEIGNSKSYSTSKGVRIKITMPDLSMAVLTGSGAINIVQSGSGLPVLEIRGSGVITCRGTARSVTASVAGSGGIDLTKLVCETGIGAISGSGTIEFGELQELDAEITGSGGITYRGKPKLRTNITGSGVIEGK